MIDEYRERLSARRMCELASVSKSAYYDWLFKVPVDDSLRRLELEREIEQIVLEFPGYGYRRVTAELKRRGKCINHKKVLLIMQERRLTKKAKRRFVKTTDSDHTLPIYPNLIKEFIPSDINQLWVADITYIRLRYEFVYLAAIMDAFSRRVIGFSIQNTLSKELSLSALRMALAKRDFGKGLIHHSDRGVQYACGDYIDLLSAHGILISMSRVGNPYDNAQAESFMATLKKEEVNLSEYENILEAQSRIGYFIEDVYNQKRLHSSLGYLPPAEFESDLTTKCLI